MSHRPIVMYVGGFAKVGGIESFARDFLFAIAKAHPARELVMWGRHEADHQLLNEIVDSGTKVVQSPWRWGCKWNLPDYLLMPVGLRAIGRAAAVVFQRPPPAPVLYLLRRASLFFGRPIPFILIMPYRPLEYWGATPDPTEYEHFDTIVVQSEQGITDLRQMGYRGRVENIPYLPPRAGAPLDLPLSRGDGTVRLGFLGRLVAQKNLDYLLESYHVLTSQIDPSTRYELHLFGEGIERTRLEQKARLLALPRITFHGEISSENVPAALDSCDLFLNTSTTEGQCLVALEVLSRGRPLVATPVGALPEVVFSPEVGRLAPLRRPEAFAAAISEVATALQKNRITPPSIVHAFRCRYDYETIVQRYLALLAGATSLVPDLPTHAEPEAQTVSVMITTKNRVDELRRTCCVLRQLAPQPLEILITADGCTDDTVSFLRLEMAFARLFINETGRGSIAARDHMLRAAQGDLVLSLDDDSYPQEADCLTIIIKKFAQNPRTAVLHFPQCTDEYPETLPRFDFGTPRPTRSYSSAGAVLRRSAYLKLPGFEPSFFHAYEEPDYVLQCVAGGYEVIYDPAVSIRHHYSGTARNECRTHHRHARNEFWSTLLRCPFPQLLFVAPYRIFSQFRYACSRGLGWVIREPIWWMQALAGIPRNLARRRSVSWTDYRRWLEMTEIVYPPLPRVIAPIENGTTPKPTTA